MRWAAAAAVLGCAACACVACAHGVRVQTQPVDAVVIVNGEEKGTAPVTFYEETGGSAPTTIEARAPGHRAKRVVVYPTSWSVPVSLAGLGCGALACAGCVGTSLALSVVDPPLIAGVALGLPLLLAPTVVAGVMGRQLPDVVDIQLEPLPEVAHE